MPVPASVPASVNASDRAFARASPLLPRPTLRAYLVLVMLVATVPLALLMAYQLFDDMQVQQRRVEDGLQRSAQALQASVERELAASVDVLTQLSRRVQPGADGDPLPSLRQVLREQALPAHWHAVYLRGADGQLRFDSTGAMPALPRLDAAGISGSIAQGDRRGTVVEVPLVSAGTARSALGAWIDASHWQRLVDSSDAPADGGRLAIVGRDGQTIARTGSTAQEGTTTPQAAATPGVQRVALADGSFAYRATRTVTASGWPVHAQLAAGPIESAQRRALLTALATATACLLLGVALATLLARRVTEPLIELAGDGAARQRATPVVREIAQLCDALAAAQEQEARSRAHLQSKAGEFQALFAGTPVGLAYSSDGADGRVLHNAAMDALIGPADGAAMVEIVERGQVLPPAEQPLRRAMRSGREVGPLELELRSASAPQRHVLARAVPLFDHDRHARGAVAVMVEITERKRAEQRLLESDQRLRQSLQLIDLAQDAGGVGFFQFQFDGSAGTWTPGQARLWGIDAAQSPPSAAGLLRRVHRDDRKTLLAQWRAMIAAGRERETFELRTVAPEHAPRWLSTRVMLSYGAERRPSRVVGVTIDVSEHKRAEAERAVLIAGEQAARQQAEAANRAKDEFLAMLGHELRNPLGAISSAVQVLDRVGTGTELAAQARLIIGRQTRHLAHLMDDLLDVGRVISGKVLLSTRRIELGALVEHVLADFELTGVSQHHDLHRELAAVWVEADPTRIEQVVGNLLGNACKHTPPGRRIDVVLTRREHRALLEVRDQGAGIPAALLPRIFDLFVQGERPIDRPGGGLGIGLTLVRRLVELHGGHVSARSSPAGTTFQVTLPAVAAPQARDDAPARASSPPRRVLLVDDNADVLAAMRSMLELDGHVVSTAADGPRALALLIDERPDAAIVDIGLPGLSGYEVARQSRRAGYAGKLFALSGYSGAADAAQARRHGFDAHLAKPVDAQRLAELVAQA